MRLLFAILVGKLIALLTRILKIGGGSAAPGLWALRIEPKLIEKLSRKIPKNIIITGTNGKTTTARILAHLAKEAGLKVIRNHTGSNLERGIASALINHISLGVNVFHFGSGLASHVGIWEVDEAAFNSLALKLKPNIIVFLNAFRDQLDRYGEVDTVVKNWGGTLSKVDPKVSILVNGDDTNIIQLKSSFEGKVETFGVEDYKIVGESLEHLDTTTKLDFEAKNVKTNGLLGSTFELFINHSSLIINLPIPGIYHIYDAVAALATASHLNLPIHQLTSSLVNFSPAFGRVEKLPFGYIFLIKNPAGATQVFETLAPQIKPEDRLLIALNDNFADGTDVSWIWDAEYEKLISSLRALAKQSRQESNSTNLPAGKAGIATSPSVPRNDINVICSGTRVNDLAVRLKYAGVEPSNIHVEPNLQSALKEARKGLKGQLFILPTYTALLELQSLLEKTKIKQHYWKEQ